MALIGGQINTSNYPQPDYSGVVNAGQMQAQGLANIGAGIGKVIDNFSQVKKEQKKVDAYNKASAKSIEAAITLGKSYQIKGVEETLNPFLESYNDPNLSPIEKAALLDEGKAMIPNVFGRFDKNQAALIEQAQNAPAPAAPLTFKRELLDVGGKPLAVQEGSDGQLYSEDKRFQITNLQAYAEGKPPEIYSARTIPAANPIDGALNMFPDMNGTPGSMPPVGTPNPLLPALTPQDEAAINAILAAGQLAPQVGEPPASIARPQYTPRFIPTDEASAKNMESYRPFTPEEIARYGSDGQVSSTGKVYPIRQPSGTEFTINPDGSSTYKQGAGVGGKAEALAKAERASEFEETRQTNFIIDKANEAEEIIDYSISKYGPGTLVDMAKSTIPGTQEYKLKNQILPAMKDSIALSSLKQLKAASPTGASGLGSLTEKEGKRLENMYGVLDVGGDKVTLKNDIKRLKQTVFDYIHGSKNEREEALVNGDITKDQNDQVEKMYREQILGITAPAAPTAAPYTGLDDETKKALKDLGVKIDE